MIEGQDHTLKRGNLRRFKDTIKDAKNEPLDLRNFTVEFNLYREGVASPLITKSSLDSGQIKVNDPLSGEAIIVLRSEDTKNLQVGRYPYEINLIDNDDQQSTVTTGNITLI